LLGLRTRRAKGATHMLNYFLQLKPGKMVLWCYLIWYLCTVFFYFDPDPLLWLNAAGISAVVGCALYLSVGPSQNHWQTARLFMMPFAVSSFSSLIKNKGFW
jgi:hypothetical protein